MFTMYIVLSKGQQPSFKTFLSGGDKGTAIHSKFLDDKLKCVHLYRCFSEVSGDDHISRTIETKFSERIIDFSHTTLSANDIENIAVFLTHCSIKQWKKLCLMSCHIQDAGLRILHQALKSSFINIEELRLTNNDLSFYSDYYLGDIAITCGVNTLDISYNKTVGQTDKFFSRILSSQSSMINELYIADNNLPSLVAIKIFTILKERKTKLKWLDMAGNAVTDNACNIIAEALQVNTTLKYLNIHGNKISKEAAQLILNSLQYNNVLEDLMLPDSYNEDVEQHMLTFQNFVNEERKKFGYQVLLNVEFSGHFF